MQFEVDPRRVVHETIDGEAILIQMETGFYYSLEGAGSEIWNALVAGRSPAEIAAELRAQYEAPPDVIEQAVTTLVDALLEERLVDEAHGPSPNGSPPAGMTPGDTGAATPRAAFAAPELHRYTDMADFMLIDPIHEVEESGWPNPKPGP